MITALVRFFERGSSDNRGRTNPPQPGYRPSIVIRGVYTSCSIESIDDAAVFLFEKEHRVALKLMFADQFPNAFSVGQTVEFYEGNRLVGAGTILSV